ncbi:MAG TPA: hypothetical protein VGY58_18685, partial [Gemmataceae bacterium]|nr:hypothetical protein [Gemmataceae bacterium]
MNYEVKAGDEAIPNAPAKREIPTSHPVGFYFIFWGEFAERCSYYGMRAILPLYLASGLLFKDLTKVQLDEHAIAIYSYFKAACYFLPLL